MKNEVFSPIFEPWYCNLTDKQIKACQGDYYGCNICRNARRCTAIKIEELEKALKKSKMEKKK